MNFIAFSQQINLATMRRVVVYGARWYLWTGNTAQLRTAKQSQFLCVQSRWCCRQVRVEN